MCVTEDSHRNIWVGTRHGLFRYNASDNSFTRFTVADGLPNDFVYGILEDELARLWISTNNGMACFDTRKNSFRRYTLRDGIANNQFNLYSYCRSRDGIFWFGGIGGITWFRPHDLVDNPFAPEPQITGVDVADADGDRRVRIERDSAGRVTAAAFPSVLVNANTGIAVGMASSICPFNLAEVCTTAAELIRDPKHDIFTTMQAPDFPGGGQIIFDRAAMEQIYKTGRGSIKVRSRYTYDKSANCIDITQIPPTTTIEAIVEKVIDLVKQGKVKEITDIRDETGLDGLKITIDLKRGADPDKLMQRLFRMTTLEDSFSCNFNVLIAGVPRVLGVRELFEEWTAFRMECVRRRTHYDLTKKKEKLHLLYGLKAILLDIDKAVRIVRETEEESEVVPNLMIGFGIDEIQAEYVAEIRLRHLNREFILKRTEEVNSLEEEIRDLEAILASKTRIKTIIVRELNEIAQKYGQPRRSHILYAEEIAEEEPVETVPDYPVNLFFTKEGYFKKITPLSLRMGGDQKLKEGDEIAQQMESTNAAELLFFSDKAQVYKLKAADFADTKASVMGEYVPARVQMDEGESAAYMAVTTDFKGYMLFVFDNGKVAKVELSAYYTKTNRRKLINAYSDKAPLTAALQILEDCDVLLTSSSGRRLLMNTALIAPKTTKSTQGVAVMNLKKGQRITDAHIYQEDELQNPSRYRKKIPALGALPNGEEGGEQISL